MTMRHSSIDRRSFMRGVGAAAIALPFMRALKARAEAPIRRFLIFQGTNGTITNAWTPSGGEQDFRLPPMMAALEPFREKILLIDGLANTVGGPGGSHFKGAAMLTGAELNAGPFKGTGWAAGPSVDQFIAQQTGVHRTLALGVGVEANPEVVGNKRRILYRGSDDPVQSEDDPFKAYQRVFGQAVEDPGELTTIRAGRASVLDSMRRDLTRLRARLGREHQQALDQHLQSVRNLESDLDDLATSGGGGACSCAPEPAGRIDNLYASENVPMIGKLHMDLLVASLCCDWTRVGVLQWGRAGARYTYPHLSINEEHHELGHRPDSDGSAQQKLVRINTWYTEQFAYLLRRLSETPDVDGTTLLDNTVIFWGNELSVGNTHSLHDLKLVVAGGGWYFKPGRYLRYDNVPHNNLFVSLCNAMGVDVEVFGDPRYCSGPLDRLT